MFITNKTKINKMSNLVESRTLITLDYIKLYGPLPSNYNMEEIKPFINVSERLWIEPIIGMPLYEELLDEVEKDEVTPENATLLLNIYPLLSFAIVYESLPFVSYHITQIGITKGASENSTSVSINDVNYISTQLRNQCETMKKLLKKFLDENAEHYPLYYADNNEECDCSNDCEDYQWIYDYYNGGTYDKYAWQRAVSEMRMRKFGPRPYNQLYTTRRYKMNLQ